MIQKLRRKFVAVVMGAAAVILLTVFAVLVISTETGMIRQSEAMLKTALELDLRDIRDGGRKDKDTPRFEGVEPPDGQPMLGEQPVPGDQPAPGKLGQRQPYFLVLVQSDGTVDLGSRAEALLTDLNTEELEALALDVAGRQEDSGDLSAHRLRYAKRERPDGVLIAFADVSTEVRSLTELIKNSLIIGSLTLLVFFGASILLARWAVRPVETAWNQQKQFVADASHELKTPLTVILSNADMILTHPDESPDRWAQNILAEAQHMKGLTQDLLSLAHSEDSAYAPVMETVDFSYLVTDSVLSFEPAAFEQGHELLHEEEPGLLLLGDASGLSQLCGILLDNALKYSLPGGAVKVSLKGAGKLIRLSVSNEGAPIPEEDLTRIFERFYRSDPARHGEGYGLGLAIARRITEQHRGKIWAESSEGINTFTVTLPSAKNSGAHRSAIF